MEKQEEFVENVSQAERRIISHIRNNTQNSTFHAHYSRFALKFALYNKRNTTAAAAEERNP